MQAGAFRKMLNFVTYDVLEDVLCDPILRHTKFIHFLPLYSQSAFN